MTLRDQIAHYAAALADLGQPATPFSLRAAIVARHGDAPSAQTIRRELHAMQAEGLVERTGSGKSTSWVVAG